MEFGLPVCPLDRPPEAKGDLILILTHMNWADLLIMNLVNRT